MEQEHTANSDTLPSPSYRSATPQDSIHHQQHKLQQYHQQMNANLAHGDHSQEGLNPMLLENEDDRISLMQRNATLMKGSNMNLNQPAHYFPATSARQIQQGPQAVYSTSVSPNAGFVQSPNGEIIQLQPMPNQGHPQFANPNFYDPNEIFYQPQQLNHGYVPVRRPQQTIPYDSCPAICSIFAIFCCPITLWCTVPALVYSICAYSDYTAQDWIRYRRRSDRARRLVIAACITGLLLCIIFSIILYFYHEKFLKYLTSVFNCFSREK